MAAVDIIDAEVRGIIRREGIDPVAQRDVVQKIVADVITSYGEQALVRSLPALGDQAEITRTLVDNIAGYGPLQRYFDDPEVEEIWINEPSRVFVARRGISELTTTILTQEEVEALVERMLKSSGRRVDLSNPFVDALLPDGSRLHVVIPDITARYWAVNIRKFVVRAASLDDLVSLGTLNRQAATFLDACVVAGLNILVSGGTQAGKTTLLNCLLAAVPAQQRVLTCEEVFELKPPLPDVLAMQTRQPSLEGTGEITLRRLVKETLRKRPDRVVVGEVRQEEAFDLLLVLSSGKPGMCTLHASSAREAIRKLCLLPLLASGNISSGFVVPTVASCVDVVVHADIGNDGRRRVTEIVAVPGRYEGDVIELEPIFTRHDDELARADGYPPHPAKFERAGIHLPSVLDGELHGVS
ncbi:CpaF family protein [Phytoactinopolyspora alkaliphila]|uniref:CpaF family protein n=1 Tax=Phytoactinopolyspora alkaliphila TaxID=1783498 RepID=A0A6N9YM15_9ACTN|nr:ATPase, T2SS/T4P/T4SS family [Phytoactinopolyspora alkaliphila]NED96076.1 CpaF family protein [Phytoactinopolyspora alkaliphila]